MGIVTALARPSPQHRRQFVVSEASLVEPWIELAAIADEGADFATYVRKQSRRIMSAIAAGKGTLAGFYADELERACDHAGTRAKIAAASARLALAELSGTTDPDAITEPGHGHAA